MRFEHWFLHLKIKSWFEFCVSQYKSILKKMNDLFKHIEIKTDDLFKFANIVDIIHPRWVCIKFLWFRLILANIFCMPFANSWKHHLTLPRVNIEKNCQYLKHLRSTKLSRRDVYIQAKTFHKMFPYGLLALLNDCINSEKWNKVLQILFESENFMFFKNLHSFTYS